MAYFSENSTLLRRCHHLWIRYRVPHLIGTPPLSPSSWVHFVKTAKILLIFLNLVSHRWLGKCISEELRCCSGCWIAGTGSSFWQAGFTEHFVSDSIPQSLLTSLGHCSSDETMRRQRIPCALPAAGTRCQYCYYSYLHSQQGVFCAVSDLHIKTCSEQEWELMSCLLCAALSEINRPGRMKGPCVTKSSNGKFLMTWNIRKGVAFLSNASTVAVYFYQLFQGSEAR